MNVGECNTVKSIVTAVLVLVSAILPFVKVLVMTIVFTRIVNMHACSSGRREGISKEGNLPDAEQQTHPRPHTGNHTHTHTHTQTYIAH